MTCGLNTGYVGGTDVTGCDLCEFSCKPPQSYTFLRTSENDTETVWVYCLRKLFSLEVCLLSLASQKSISCHTPFEFQGGKKITYLNWFAWLLGIRFLMTGGTKGQFSPAKKNKPTRKWKGEEEREALGPQGWYDHSQLQSFYQILSLPNTGVAAAVLHNGTMSVKTWDQSEIAPWQIKNRPSGQRF